MKRLATFPGAGAVGAGTIIYASEPAAAVNHHVEIDDTTIELSAEEGELVGLAEFGLSDMWFEVQWENIETSLYADIVFVNDSANTPEVHLSYVDFDVTVKRVSPGAEAGDGQADAYGASE